MTLQDPVDDVPPVQKSIAALAVLCQETFSHWQQATNERERDARGAQHRGCVESLWFALESDLMRAARRWARSQIAPDLESLAMDMFTYLIFALPTLRIDPTQNVRGFLLLVASRGMIDDYRRNYTSPGRKSSSNTQPQPTSGDSDGQMWSGQTMRSDAIAPNDEAFDHVDTASYDAEDRIARELDNQEVLRELWSYWSNELPVDDQRIVRFRWLSEPPRSFKEIAELMGAGWLEATVRQRHYRVLKETRAHLHSLGLIDDPDA